MTSAESGFVKNADDDPNCATFTLNDEDHTLGNALRYMITKNPNVHFCGYSMPHPNERKVIMQIQTYKNTITPWEAFHEGLTNLLEKCTQMKSVFQKAFKKTEQSPSENTDTESDGD